MALVRRHSARLCPFRWMRDCEETHERARFRSAAERSRLYIHYSSAFGLSHSRFKRSFPFFLSCCLFLLLLVWWPKFYSIFHHLIINLNDSLYIITTQCDFTYSQLVLCVVGQVFFLRRDDDDEVVCETTLLYLYEDSRSFPTSVCLFLGCWFIFFEICVDGPFRVVLFVSRFLFGQELTSRHVYIALIYT